jgi:hypothetical protein
VELVFGKWVGNEMKEDSKDSFEITMVLRGLRYRAGGCVKRAKTGRKKALCGGGGCRNGEEEGDREGILERLTFGMREESASEKSLKASSERLSSSLIERWELTGRPLKRY